MTRGERFWTLRGSARRFAPVTVIVAVMLALAFSGCATGNEEDEPTKAPKTWTKATVNTTESISGLAYGKGVFVAATTANLGADPQVKAKIFWSTDGVTWTEADASDVLTGTNSHYVYFFNDIGTFFVVDRRGSNNSNGAGGNWVTSTDGKVWTKITGVPDVATAGGGAYGNGAVVIGSSSSSILFSDNFTTTSSTWTSKATGVTRDPTLEDQRTVVINWVNSVAYGKGKFVIGGMNGNIAYSTDKTATWKYGDDIKWATGSNVFGNATINQIVFDGNTFLAVGGNPGVAATSPDGITWTQTGDIQLGTTSDYLYAGYGGGVFIATWQGNASYSTDAFTWTLIANTQFGTNSINAISYGAGKYVMVGGGGTIAYSTPE
jgi:hypothetical protein